MGVVDFPSDAADLVLAFGSQIDLQVAVALDDIHRGIGENQQAFFVKILYRGRFLRGCVAVAKYVEAVVCGHRQFVHPDAVGRGSMEDVELGPFVAHAVVALFCVALGGDVVDAYLLAFSAADGVVDDAGFVLVRVDESAYGCRQLGIGGVGIFLLLVGLHRHLLTSDGERL